MEFGPFKDVRPEDAAAVETIAAFLARNDGADAGELVVLAGNDMIWTLESAVTGARKLGVPLLIAGGIGHSTARLKAAIAAHPRYGALTPEAPSEAEILREVAIRFLEFPAGLIIVENRSTNCAENAAFSGRVLEAEGLSPASLLLVQDPLLQRRTDASFRQAWGGATEIVNHPLWTPKLVQAGGVLTFLNPPGPLWSPQRFLELLLGEVPRLRDDTNGYGPRGKGFIPHVDIPEPVEAAFRHLTGCGRFAGAASRLSVPG